MDANANEPTAHGMVLAMMVDRAGKPGKAGPVKGQLYVSGDEIVVVRPSTQTEILNRAALLLLLVPVVLVLVNVFTWKSFKVLFGSAIALATYSLIMPFRRRAFAPIPLSAAGLSAVRAAGRVAIDVPARAVTRLVPPEPPRAGFRKPARFELLEGALEVYLSEEQFHAVASSLGR